MDREKFEELVEIAVKKLPEEFLDRLDNVDVLVEDQPKASQLRKAGLKSNQTLLGLYEGVPQTRRSSGYGMVLPDKITIFQGPIEAKCRNGSEIIAEIENVVKHEIAHHFGISDARLRELGRY
ncbi:MAG: metallopeptidase family protein [Dehalococcoidales bacterium]|nr:metallopeptidase family protein [Dehalococcoidales bacterium]